MTIEQFAEEVCAELEKKFEGSRKVEQRTITKNNNAKFHAVLVSGQNDTMIPTFYLEDFYKNYREGCPISEVVLAIYHYCKENTPKGQIPFEWFEDFDSVKDNICYKLVNKNANNKMLENVPHVDFLDLAICFYVVYCDERIGDGTILIKNDFLENWKVAVVDLMRCAEENTVRLYPADRRSIEELLREIRGTDCDTPSNFRMDVLTNSNKTYGAAVILYPEVLKDYSVETGGSFYIIPSSVHEVLLLPANGNEDPEELRKMIAEVNNTQMELHEILSYNVYFYDVDLSKVVIK